MSESLRVGESFEYSEAKLSYKIPDTMIIDKVYSISIKISADSIVWSSDVFDDSHVSDIKATSIMEVMLVAPDTSAFTVSKANPRELQLIEDSGHTEWLYNVKARKRGSNELYLVVSTIKDGHYKDFSIKHEVKVEAIQGYEAYSWLSTNWKWLTSTIFIPLMIWYRRRQSKQ